MKAFFKKKKQNEYLLDAHYMHDGVLAIGDSVANQTDLVPAFVDFS